ncbi:MAG TPA: hypothetical protein VNT32_01580 [Thermoleophilaceae bacterium]|nr:hypothetical protein [Thermoleophilaceae bacterium]
MPELPESLAALVADLEDMGFETEREEWHPWPGGGDMQLRRPRTRGVKRVRMMQDRGPWDLEVQIGRGWYEPYTALLALDERPHQQRALSHAERHAVTIKLVQRFTGSRTQRRAIKDRAKQLSLVYTRWAEGEVPPK